MVSQGEIISFLSPRFPSFLFLPFFLLTIFLPLLSSPLLFLPLLFLPLLFLPLLFLPLLFLPLLFLPLLYLHHSVDTHHSTRPARRVTLTSLSSSSLSMPVFTLAPETDGLPSCVHVPMGTSS